jgi:hypothetical protein
MEKDSENSPADDAPSAGRSDRDSTDKQSKEPSIWRKTTQGLQAIATTVGAAGSTVASTAASVGNGTVSAIAAAGTATAGVAGAVASSAVAAGGTVVEKTGLGTAAEAVVDRLDQVTGKQLVELLEERLRIQDEYNDVLATRLAEALERIASLEEKLGHEHP